MQHIADVAENSFFIRGEVEILISLCDVHFSPNLCAIDDACNLIWVWKSVDTLILYICTYLQCIYSQSNLIGNFPTDTAKGICTHWKEIPMQMLSILLFHANETMEGNPPNLVKGKASPWGIGRATLFRISKIFSSYSKIYLMLQLIIANETKRRKINSNKYYIKF